MGVLPKNSIDDGSYTRNNEPAVNFLPGFTKRYAESQHGLDSVTPAGNDGMIVEDYRFRESYALDAQGTYRLNANEAVRTADNFKRNRTGKADVRDDQGLMTGLKLRCSYPTVKAESEVVRGTGDNGANPTAMGSGAYWDQSLYRYGNRDYRNNFYYWLGRDGAVQRDTIPDANAFQYGDTLWYQAKFSNLNNGYAQSGRLMHAKIVFAMHLPKQVTFYTDKMLTDDPALAARDAGYKLIDDYVGDDYQFLVEWYHWDRHKKTFVTEHLTPKQLVANGWTVKVVDQPNYTSNNYDARQGGIDYGKPDADQPDDEAAANIKTYAHDEEVVVIELAPPDDASDA